MFVKKMLEESVVDKDLFNKMNLQERTKKSGILPYVGQDANGNGLHDELSQKIEMIIGELSSEKTVSKYGEKHATYLPLL